MSGHQFGGEWTTEKLERLREYLCAYMRIFSKNSHAARYTTVYVDAFAGTGHRVDSKRGHAGSRLFETELDPDAAAYRKGSARIALEVRPPFSRYIFIELSAERVAELELLKRQMAPTPDSVKIVNAEANQYLAHWCSETDWRQHRAVVFLDPYGMQVDWATLEALGRTRAVDLWLLFPLGMAVTRLLRRDAPPGKHWADALTRIFGTEAWRTAFYSKRDEPMLFEVESEQRRDVDWRDIGRFFVARLTTIFAAVADNPLPLRNSRNTLLYLLCFAAGNKRGAPLAVKIAKHILEPRGVRGELLQD